MVHLDLGTDNLRDDGDDIACWDPRRTEVGGDIRRAEIGGLDAVERKDVRFVGRIERRCFCRRQLGANGAGEISVVVCQEPSAGSRKMALRNRGEKQRCRQETLAVEITQC